MRTSRAFFRELFYAATLFFIHEGEMKSKNARFSFFVSSLFSLPACRRIFFFSFFLQISRKKGLLNLLSEKETGRDRYEGGRLFSPKFRSTGDGARSIVARVYEARSHFGTSRRARRARHRHPARAAGLLRWPGLRDGRAPAPRRRHPSHAAAPSDVVASPAHAPWRERMDPPSAF